jgi:hypothetical protein
MKVSGQILAPSGMTCDERPQYPLDEVMSVPLRKSGSCGSRVTRLSVSETTERRVMGSSTNRKGFGRNRSWCNRDTILAFDWGDRKNDEMEVVEKRKILG